MKTVIFYYQRYENDKNRINLKDGNRQYILEALYAPELVAFDCMRERSNAEDGVQLGFFNYPKH